MSRPTIVFDVNETLLDLRGLDAPFTAIFGSVEARADWFKQLLQLSLLANTLDDMRISARSPVRRRDRERSVVAPTRLRRGVPPGGCDGAAVTDPKDIQVAGVTRDDGSRRARLRCAGRRDRKRRVIAPVRVRSPVPPGGTDCAIRSNPEHVEVPGRPRGSAELASR